MNDKKKGRERGSDATVCFTAGLTQNRTLLTQTVRGKVSLPVHMTFTCVCTCDCWRIGLKGEDKVFYEFVTHANVCVGG